MKAKKYLIVIAVCCIVFSLFSVSAPNVKALGQSASGMVRQHPLLSNNSTLTTPLAPPNVGSSKFYPARPSLPLDNITAVKLTTQPCSTPALQRQANGSYAMSQSPLMDTNHWWIIDYWANSQNQLPDHMYGEFTAAPNTIGFAGSSEIMYLPLNVAYGTSPTNDVWFQFSVAFFPDRSVVMTIWDNLGPATVDSDYNSTDVPTDMVHYHEGDTYSYSLTTSGTNTVTFAITDTTTGDNWSKSNWKWTVPSRTMLYDQSQFSPASAVEGLPASGALTDVPYFQSYVGSNLQTHWKGTNGPVPVGIDTQTTAAYYYWSMICAEQGTASYYVTSVNSYGGYGAGYAANPNGIIGNTGDGNCAYFYGGNFGDGGYLFGNLNTVAGGTVSVWGYSDTGYTSTLYVYGSMDNQNWYEIGQPLSISDDYFNWHTVGTVTTAFKYIYVTGYDGNGFSTSLHVDDVWVN